MTHWPGSVPMFRNGGPRNDQEIHAISDACNTVEDTHQIPFRATDPTQPTTTKANRRTKREPVS